MVYIAFDLEFNQDFASLIPIHTPAPHQLFEIIQIGAVKLDQDLNTLSTFSRYVKPAMYARVNPFITKLTGITTKQLLEEDLFPAVYRDFVEFIAGKEPVFCVWGTSDMNVLFRNIAFHKLNEKMMPLAYINLQPHVARALGHHWKRQLQLKGAVETLSIEQPYSFHHALHDAYYTAEIFKRVCNPSIIPTLYDPSCNTVRVRHKKRNVDYEGLMHQFEKMYGRQLAEEEKAMIKLAYKMGRTHQFVKEH